MALTIYLVKFCFITTTRFSTIRSSITTFFATGSFATRSSIAMLSLTTSFVSSLPLSSASTLPILGKYI